MDSKEPHSVQGRLSPSTSLQPETRRSHPVRRDRRLSHARCQNGLNPIAKRAEQTVLRATPLWARLPLRRGLLGLSGPGTRSTTPSLTSRGTVGHVRHSGGAGSIRAHRDLVRQNRIPLSGVQQAPRPARRAVSAATAVDAVSCRASLPRSFLRAGTVEAHLPPSALSRCASIITRGPGLARHSHSVERGLESGSSRQHTIYPG
jgi:hypothetical protein